MIAESELSPHSYSNPSPPHGGRAFLPLDVSTLFIHNSLLHSRYEAPGPKGLESVDGFDNVAFDLEGLEKIQPGSRKPLVALHVRTVSDEEFVRSTLNNQSSHSKRLPPTAAFRNTKGEKNKGVLYPALSTKDEVAGVLVGTQPGAGDISCLKKKPHHHFPNQHPKCSPTTRCGFVKDSQRPPSNCDSECQENENRAKVSYANKANISTIVKKRQPPWQQVTIPNNREPRWQDHSQGTAYDLNRHKSLPSNRAWSQKKTEDGSSKKTGGGLTPYVDRESDGTSLAKTMVRVGGAGTTIPPPFTLNAIVPTPLKVVISSAGSKVTPTNVSQVSVMSGGMVGVSTKMSTVALNHHCGDGLLHRSVPNTSTSGPAPSVVSALSKVSSVRIVPSPNSTPTPSVIGVSSPSEVPSPDEDRLASAAGPRHSPSQAPLGDGGGNHSSHPLDVVKRHIKGLRPHDLLPRHQSSTRTHLQTSTGAHLQSSVRNHSQSSGGTHLLSSVSSHLQSSPVTNLQTSIGTHPHPHLQSSVGTQLQSSGVIHLQSSAESHLQSSPATQLQSSDGTQLQSSVGTHLQCTPTAHLQFSPTTHLQSSPGTQQQSPAATHPHSRPLERHLVDPVRLLLDLPPPGSGVQQELELNPVGVDPLQDPPGPLPPHPLPPELQSSDPSRGCDDSYREPRREADAPPDRSNETSYPESGNVRRVGRERRRERRERRRERRALRILGGPPGPPGVPIQTELGPEPRPLPHHHLPDLLNSHVPPPYSTLPNGPRALGGLLGPPPTVGAPPPLSPLQMPPPPPPVPPLAPLGPFPPPGGPTHGSPVRPPMTEPPWHLFGSRRSRGSRRVPSRLGDEEAKSCCGLLVTQAVSIRWFIIMISFVGLCCTVVGTVLGAVKTNSSEYVTITLLMIGVGIVLITVSGVAWHLTSRDAPCRVMLGLAPNDSGRGETRRFMSRMAPTFGRPHHPYAAMMYPDFQFRPPPPSYQASMQEYRLRLFLLDRHGTQQFPGASTLPSPPPTYRSGPYNIRGIPSVVDRRFHTLFSRRVTAGTLSRESDYSRPPSYRSREGSVTHHPDAPPSVDPGGGGGTPAHSRDPSCLSFLSHDGSARLRGEGHKRSPCNTATKFPVVEGGTDPHGVNSRGPAPTSSKKGEKAPPSPSKDDNTVTIVQTTDCSHVIGSESVIVTVSGNEMTNHRAPCNNGTEISVLAHL